MTKIKAILIDDEEAARNILGSLIGLSNQNIEIVGQAKDLISGIELIKEHKPDVVFLDVEMPNYAGYEIVNLMDKIDFHIIFVTAYNQYAINAFEINAIDYIMKPIKRDRLNEAIKKVSTKINKDVAFKDYQKLINNFDSNQKTIAFSEAGMKHILKLDEIIAINAFGAYSKVILKNNKSLMISKNIGTINKKIEEYDCFIRTHKSWIINKEHIVSYQSGKQTITLLGDVITKLSRFKKENFEMTCLS